MFLQDSIRNARLDSLDAGKIFWRCIAVLLGTAFLTLGSYISVPMFPVPLSMQTLTIALVGSVFGWKWGVVTVLAWLGEAALGAPVLTPGSSGIQGPTAGYIFAFPVYAAIIGFFVPWNVRSLCTFSRVSVAVLCAELFCLSLGTAWLSLQIGFPLALSSGFYLFVPGAFCKAFLAACMLSNWSGGRVRDF